MTETNRKASATARTRATTKYHKTHYKRMYISTTPDQADYIRETAKKYDITIVQLIIDSIKCYEKIAGADTEQPEIVTAESPMKSGETAGAQPEEETENEIEEEEETTEEENQTAGAETTAEEEEPQEDEETTEEEAEDIPEELKAVRAAWARMGAFNEKITAERKRREAEERERRREITDEERYMMR